jgi:hypothetical protein
MSGRETGCIFSREMAEHSRMGILSRYENGKQLGNQIRWLYDNIYKNQQEEIHLLTSHDPSQIEDYTRNRLIGDKFE